MTTDLYWEDGILKRRPPVVTYNDYIKMQEQAKALRMYNLWRERRLPADVEVISVSIERTGYGDFRYRLPVYGALPTQVLYDEQEPFSLHATVAVQMHRYADGAGGELLLGWNEYPPRLIVGTEARREAGA